MADTYFLRATEPASQGGNAILAIYNGPGSGKIVNVHDIYFDPIFFYIITPIGSESIRRISACGKGVPCDYAKLNSASANLPSTILLQSNPEVTLDTTYGSLAILANLSFPHFRGNARTLPASVPAAGTPLDLDASAWIKSWQKSNSSQQVTLRQNQGLCLYCDGQPTMTNFLLNIIFKLNSTSAVYTVSHSYSSQGQNTAPFAIFNSDSTEVIEILGWNVLEIGDETIPQFLVVPFGGIQERTGDEITILKMDSSSPNLPSQIKAYKDIALFPVGSSVGFTGVSWVDPDGRSGLPSFVKYMDVRTVGGGPIYASAATQGQSQTPANVLVGAGLTSTRLLGDMSIEIPPGRGLAVVQCIADIGDVATWTDMAGIGRYQFMLQFSTFDAYTKGFSA